jgi:hypothetical protein
MKNKSNDPPGADHNDARSASAPVEAGARPRKGRVMIRPQSSSEASADASEVNQNIGFKLLRKKELLVPGRGLEPPRCYPLVPETSASTNSATRAGLSECPSRARAIYAGGRELSIESA